MHSGVPSEYRGQVNPLALTPDVIRAGAELYGQQCAACHGPQGMGDGEAGKDLNPSPALLAYMVQMPMSVDKYLLWTISDGGQQFGTAMPAFKGSLSTEDIWKIVAFMRAGFPPIAQINQQ
jgi:mono/diheme cytochrome c family protein